MQYLLYLSTIKRRKHTLKLSTTAERKTITGEKRTSNNIKEIIEVTNITVLPKICCSKPYYG